MQCFNLFLAMSRIQDVLFIALFFRKSKFTPNRAPRRKGRKFSEVKHAKYEKEEKKSLVKTKRKYKRFQKKHSIEASTEQTTTVKQELVKSSRNRKRKLRMRKRL